jgi:hypothetical protein
VTHRKRKSFAGSPDFLKIPCDRRISAPAPAAAAPHASRQFRWRNLAMSGHSRLRSSACADPATSHNQIALDHGRLLRDRGRRLRDNLLRKPLGIVIRLHESSRPLEWNISLMSSRSLPRNSPTLGVRTAMSGRFALIASSSRFFRVKHSRTSVPFRQAHVRLVDAIEPDSLVIAPCAGTAS